MINGGHHDAQVDKNILREGWKRVLFEKDKFLLQASGKSKNLGYYAHKSIICASTITNNVFDSSSSTKILTTERYEFNRDLCFLHKLQCFDTNSTSTNLRSCISFWFWDEVEVEG